MRLIISGHYPADWDAVATRVKDAANWTCIRCAHPHEPASGHCLTVHHLDGDKSNCRWWNLLALCQRCHLHIQAKVIPERPWLFDHSLWFRPYVAGYYAYAYGGLELTREEVERDFARYLALGQPWLTDGAA